MGGRGRGVVVVVGHGGTLLVVAARRGGTSGAGAGTSGLGVGVVANVRIAEGGVAVKVVELVRVFIDSDLAWFTFTFRRDGFHEEAAAGAGVGPQGCGILA